MTTDERQMEEREQWRSIKASSITEALFVFLPFIIIIMVSIYQHDGTEWWRIFYIPEWAFAAVILFGQTIVRFAALLPSHDIPLVSGPVILILTILLVVFLIPSLIVLVLLLQSPQPPHIALIIAQLFSFFLALFTYLLPEYIKYHLQLARRLKQ